MKLALPLAIGLLAITAGTAQASTKMQFSYSKPVVHNSVTCRDVSGTLHLKNTVGQVLATMTNHTHWCYNYSNGLTQLPTGFTETGTGLGWDVDSQSYNKSWYTPTHGQAQTVSRAHFSLGVPILGHLQTWAPVICIVVGDKGNARNC